MVEWWLVGCRVAVLHASTSTSRCDVGWIGLEGLMEIEVELKKGDQERRGQKGV